MVSGLTSTIETCVGGRSAPCFCSPSSFPQAASETAAQAKMAKRMEFVIRCIVYPEIYWRGAQRCTSDGSQTQQKRNRSVAFLLRSIVDFHCGSISQFRDAHEEAFGVSAPLFMISIWHTCRTIMPDPIVS
ncbi:hypothetical protein AGR1B_pa0136 [Agrobacterium fabacearum S56]|nr:hypothetical protein AGR1B_pa0136 [Agrobacterium fabacearum S56]